MITDSGSGKAVSDKGGTVDLLRSRGIGGKDVQSLISTETELDRNPAASIHQVH